MKQLAITFLILLISTTGWSKKNPIPLIGDKAPSFTEKSTNGILNFPEDFGTHWKILFSHPLDFTAVCTSELCGLARNQEKFDSLGVKVAVVSIDEVERHLLWKEFMEKVLNEENENITIEYPIVADLAGEVSQKYGMLHQSMNDKRDVRGVFIIDPNNIIQAITFYPMSVGRNMDEILRTVEALQLTQNDNVLTPLNWQPGDDVLVPHKPYTSDELEKNPELKDQYYHKGEYMWFKKMRK
ncbi:redoxin domain-containing protein [Draconibacterium sp. IB214405]|uniref:peroxiredoxin n=1 Tax=Draconibacterium sp. IB214405 TaxID=3097352 RepID=UPI002A14F545|nr:redoxin domain-containing protein [Draconibacterium sp. IB214405]MDX8339363.1 redoxin domain-containing protein [Draconibacterium sp. IB214405]